MKKKKMLLTAMRQGMSWKCEKKEKIERVGGNREIDQILGNKYI